MTLSDDIAPPTAGPAFTDDTFTNHVVSYESYPATDETFLRNTWYVAALGPEVEQVELFRRVLLGEAIVMYRKEDGTPVALRDRCPHRFLPLSQGKRSGDTITCLYHALQFNADGQCIHNPHGKGDIPVNSDVPTYPLIERYGFIWIWMGDDAPDESKLPDYSRLDGKPSALGYTYMPIKAHYELVIDNVMDLSHIDHVHGPLIYTHGKLTPQIPPVVKGESTIKARWEWVQKPAMLIFDDWMPHPGDEARQFFEITWYPPASIQLSVGAQQDEERLPLNLDNTVSQYDLHTVTPETSTTTHYWFATIRNHNEDDEEYNKLKIEGMHGAFVNEDFPIIEAVQAEMGTSDFFGLKPVLMSNDAAPVRVRRMLRDLIGRENRARADS